MIPITFAYTQWVPLTPLGVKYPTEFGVRHSYRSGKNQQIPAAAIKKAEQTFHIKFNNSFEHRRLHSSLHSWLHSYLHSWLHTRKDASLNPKVG